MAQPLVLIAEDDRDLQQLLWLNLRIAGFSVVTAADGDTALRLAREHRPDAIVLDIGMPQRDGLAVLRALRARRDTVGIPVIVVSGRCSDAEIWEGWQAGADHYLTKPVRLQSLIDLITRIVRPGAASEAV